MVLCGVCIVGFTLWVFCDVVTREIGPPWLWLQQATTGFFAWGVFIGMAAATRRNDHIYLAEITKGMTGPKRTVIEIINRVVVLAVGAVMVGVRLQELPARSRQLPHALAHPAHVLYRIVPISGALIALFCVEQIVNGWQHGFEGPEDEDDFAGIT